MKSIARVSRAGFGSWAAESQPGAQDPGQRAAEGRAQPEGKHERQQQAAEESKDKPGHKSDQGVARLPVRLYLAQPVDEGDPFDHSRRRKDQAPKEHRTDLPGAQEIDEQMIRGQDQGDR